MERSFLRDATYLFRVLRQGKRRRAFMLEQDIKIIKEERHEIRHF